MATSWTARASARPSRAASRESRTSFAEPRKIANRNDCFMKAHCAGCRVNEIYLELRGGEYEKVGREPRPVGIGAHLEKNRRTRGLARGNAQQNAQAHQGSRPGRRRGVEVDGQVETFEESEILRDSAPEQVRHRGGGGVVAPERTQVEDGLPPCFEPSPLGELGLLGYSNAVPKDVDGAVRAPSSRRPRVSRPASRGILRSRALSSTLSNILAAVTPGSRSFPSGREECMKGPRRARMPVYGAG